MSGDTDWYRVLTEAAQARKVKVPTGIAKHADKSHSLEVDSWVRQNLESQQPLTLEELTIWQKIDSHRNWRVDYDIHGQAINHLLDAGALEHEIQRLQQSTKNTQAKSLVLKRQSELAAGLGRLDNDVPREAIAFDTKIKSQREAEIQQLSFLNHELQQDLQRDIRIVKEKLEKSLRAVQYSTVEKLKADDRILDSLNEKAYLPAFANPGEEEKRYQLLTTLRQALIFNIKTRLDQVYLRQLNAQDSKPPNNVSTDRLEETKIDLDSLYTEIEDVVSMLVQDEYGAKLKIAEEELRALANRNIVQRVSQITSCLAAIAGMADQLSTHYQHLQAQRVLHNAINEAFLQGKDRQHVNPLRVERDGPWSLCHQLQALLRHVNSYHDETTGQKNVIQQLQNRSVSVEEDCHQLVKSTARESQDFVAGRRERLAHIVGSSNKNMFQAAQEIDSLDERMALVKTRLEETYKSEDKEPDYRRRLASSFQSA